MIKTDNIKDLLKKIVKEDDLRGKVCVVRSIDTDYYTIDVEPVNSIDFDFNTPNTDNYIYGVKLIPYIPEVDDNHLIGDVKVPSINSIITINSLDEGYIIGTVNQLNSFQFSTKSGGYITQNEVDGVPITIIESDKIRLYSLDFKYYFEINKTDKYINIFSDNDIDWYSKNISKIESDNLLYIRSSDLTSIQNDSITISSSNLNTTTSKYMNVNVEELMSVNSGIYILNSNTINLNSNDVYIELADNKCKLKNATTSLKSDILDEIASILTSMDTALTGLGAVDATRTAKILTLTASISSLFR